jgi:hypothetical protein
MTELQSLNLSVTAYGISASAPCDTDKESNHILGKNMGSSAYIF